MTQTPIATLAQEQTVDAKIRKHRLLWLLPFFAVFLPIVLLSIYSLQIAGESVRSVVESQNRRAAENLSQRITQDVLRNVELAHAVASLEGTIAAIEQNDLFVLRTRLKAVTVSHPEVYRAFLVNTGGILVSEFPTATGSYDTHLLQTDLSGEDWFQAVSKTGKPAISGLYVRPEFPAEPVIEIAVPSRDNDRDLGVLVFEYRIMEITKWLRSTETGNRGSMYVLDHHGNLVTHPYGTQKELADVAYGDAEPVRSAMDGVLQTTEYPDPLSGEMMIATFMPVSVGAHTWVVVAQQSRDEAFSLLNQLKRNLGFAGIILTLFTLAMVVALARISARNIRLNQDLEFKNQSLKDFTSIVSHQLKAPITAMRWNIEAVLDGDYGAISPELHTLMEELHAVNISNYRLIMDILNVSRLDRGVVAVELKPVKLKDIAERAIRDYVPAAERAGLYLRVEETQTDIMVNADLEKAAECITNSISNALKHTKAGGITVVLSAKEGKGLVQVTDTGEGMPPEILQNLFSRDGIRKSNTGAESSSGLGLYIARQFMQLQGGDIEATAVSGQGSTFTYTLNLATATTENSGEALNKEEKAQS